MRILIVDDEASIVESLSGIMTDEGYTSICADSGEQALATLDNEQVDLVLMDVWMPGIDGIETLKRIKETRPHLPVIMISGHGNIDTAVQATKIGAYDFIEKPPSYDKIVLSIKNALHLSQVEKENIILRQKARDKPELTGKSAKITELKELIKRVSPTDAWVLITGEHGTGKELVAQAIHRQSSRSNNPMIEVNCAAIPEELIESELFGHEKGSFTGATSSKRGKFDLADGSTLFLDEIADMSLKTQAKILRIIQEQKFERVGGNKTISVDVRVLAATNKNLEIEIENGNFREDLYWRLNVVPIKMPCLRERLDDLKFFVDDFMGEFATKSLGKKVFTDEALEMMSQHNWPGNVRELRNFIERTLIVSPTDEVDGDLISQLLGISKEKSDEIKAKYLTNKKSIQGECSSLNQGTSQLEGLSFKEAKKESERHFFSEKIAENDGNIAKTPEILGMERSHLHKKVKML